MRRNFSSLENESNSSLLLFLLRALLEGEPLVQHLYNTLVHLGTIPVANSPTALHPIQIYTFMQFTLYDNVQKDLHLHLHLQVDPDEDDVDKHLGDAVAHPGEEVHLDYHQIIIWAISYLSMILTFHTFWCNKFFGQ